MYELMLDLETLDTKPSAVVLSIGAVVWDTYKKTSTSSELAWEPVAQFYQALDIQSQLSEGRTVSESTLLWWMQQDSVAQAEAFSTDREAVAQVLHDFNLFAADYSGVEGPNDPGVTRFWASPNTFDFPIWDSLAGDFNMDTPWTYRQKYDVRTVVAEAGYSAKDHKADKVIGVPHTPLYDCEWQIDLLTAARNKIRRSR